MGNFITGVQGYIPLVVYIGAVLVFIHTILDSRVYSRHKYKKDGRVAKVRLLLAISENIKGFSQYLSRPLFKVSDMYTLVDS